MTGDFHASLTVYSRESYGATAHRLLKYNNIPRFAANAVP